MMTSEPVSATPPGSPRGHGDVLPYASPGARRPFPWRSACFWMALAVAVAAYVLLEGWPRYRFLRGEHHTESRQTNLVTTVQSLRAQVALFKLQHNDRLPGVCPLVASG